MDSFIEITKNINFYYARFISEIVKDDDFLKAYSKLKPNQKEFFDLIKLPDDVASVPNSYQLAITIPNFKLVKKEDIEDFKPASDFFETGLKDPISIFGRILFHYPMKDFYSEPALPVVLEEKKGDLGKVILKGMRVALPEHKEFNSVTLDTQSCGHCKSEDIFVDIQLSRVEKYTFQYLKDIIKRASEFSAIFVKNKVSKNESK